MVDPYKKKKETTKAGIWKKNARRSLDRWKSAFCLISDTRKFTDIFSCPFGHMSTKGDTFGDH